MKNLDRILLMKNLNTLLIVSGIALASTHLEAKVSKKEQPAATQTASASIQGKVLKNEALGTLNLIFAQHPIAILRINLAARSIKTALDKTDLELQLKQATRSTQEKKQADIKTEEKEVAQELEQIVAPVREFFAQIQNYNAMVQPIMQESIGAHKPNSLLMKYFNSKQELMEFAEKNVTTKETFKELTSELLQFLKDLTKSLSPEAKTAYKKLMITMRNNKK